MRRLLGVLVVLGALSASCAGAQEAAPPAVAAAAPAGVGVAPGLTLPRLEDLAETRERPLFSPTRRPPPPPPPPPAAAVAEAPVEEEPEPEPETPPPFVLAGVVTGSSLTLAVLQNRDTAEVARVRRGEEVLGWKVAEVGTKHVVLQRDGRSVRLALFEKKEEPDTTAAAQTGGKKAADEDEEDQDEDEEEE